MKILRKAPNLFPLTENLKPVSCSNRLQGSRMKVKKSKNFLRRQSAEKCLRSWPGPRGTLRKMVRSQRHLRDMVLKAHPLLLPPLTFYSSIAPSPNSLPVSPPSYLQGWQEVEGSGHDVRRAGGSLGASCLSLGTLQGKLPATSGCKAKLLGNSLCLPMGLEPRVSFRATGCGDGEDQGLADIVEALPLGGSIGHGVRMLPEGLCRGLKTALCEG